MLTTLNALFGVGPAVQIMTCDEPSAFIPRRDQAYQFREDLLRCLIIWHGGIAGRNLLVQGPTGAGKSSLIEQFCNRMRIALYRVPCHARSEFGDFTGQLTVKADGSTEFVYGALPRAMKEGGVLLFDEFNFMPPGVTGALNTVLDGGPLLLPETGEVIEPHENFRIAATGNAVEQGDDAALYRGTQRMNLALIQRFLTVKVNYLSPTEEAIALHVAAPDLPGSVIQSLVATAADVRASFSNGDIETTLATRILVKMARIMNARIGSVIANPLDEAKFALRFALLDGVKVEDANAIEGVLVRKGVTVDPTAVAKATVVTKPTVGTTDAMVHLYFNRDGHAVGKSSHWGFVEVGAACTPFDGWLTPTTEKQYLKKTTLNEATATAGQKVASSGFHCVDHFDVPVGVAHDEFIDELLVSLRAIVLAARNGHPSTVVTGNRYFDIPTKEKFYRYAQSNGVTAVIQ